ncbi:hypothetical protein RHSIM_Rhsim10G0049200 [Rhododendron simsii]|uniref:Exocyst subunit Exo70 family protein n=1 Tax=Rhododendron simsii TaxID=118357 RepID=A0A834G9J5_RHOSS|nr:hypothetical protein RHSIM_Rhsim10G0049200 [Rhododendron simsii]
MEDCKSATPTLEGEEDLIAAAQQIVIALESRRNLTSDARKILVDLGTKLSSVTKLSENKKEDEEDGWLGEIEERLNIIQDKVMNWEVEESMIFYRGSEEAYDYVKAVDEAQKLTETLESLCLDRDGEESELLRRAYDVVHTAMVRLEEEFRRMLVQKRQLFEREDVSFRSSKGDVENEGSVMSFGDESFVSFRSSIEDPENKGSVSSFWDSLSGSSSEDSIIHLVHPSVIPDLKYIAKLMFDSNHDQECRQAFISVQKDALNNRLFMLEVDKLRIDDVLKMEWGNLDSQIRRWIWVMKIFVRVYLASEKRLSDQIFGGFDSCSLICFVEASKSSMLQLLNFGKAIALGPRQPEKLVRILGMYEVLADLIPDIDALYADEIDSCVRNECQGLLRRLGYCVKATFLEFENLVASNTSTTPFPGGGIHHLTRYVMNYIKTLTDYSETLNLLLKDSGKETSVSFSPDLNPTVEDNSSIRSSFCVSPTSLHFRSLISILLCNLDDKSKLYEEDSLRHLFLMNNIHYMTQKVKDSELRTILGDDWIHKHNWKFQQQAMNYERATWSSILSLLRDEEIHYPGSNSVSRTLLKERMQGFYVAFEEVYKIQTAWLIPDVQLREDLRVSTSVKVIQAYRTFLGRHCSNLSDKSIKYSAEDLESFLLDLFEGSRKSLHSRDPQNHCTFATDIEGPCMS